MGIEICLFNFIWVWIVSIVLHKIWIFVLMVSNHISNVVLRLMIWIISIVAVISN